MTMISGRRVGVFKRWRLMLVAALAAGAMSVAFAGHALAAEPNEWNYWNNENAGGYQINTNNNISEARNGGYLMDAWRGATNNRVWLSINNGDPFTLPNPDGTYTATYVSPTVVPYSYNAFMILHTGMDGNIYWTLFFPGNSTWSGQWYRIPQQNTSVDMTVSATQIGAGTSVVYLAYHSSNDDRLWGTIFNGGDQDGSLPKPWAGARRRRLPAWPTTRLRSDCTSWPRVKTTPSG